ncbi:MAG: hypothetical protein ACYC1M_12095 [Armatimonadota bacterium]
MIEIRNLLNQPLSFQLTGQSGSLHLSSRERQILRRDEVTAEMRTAASRGFVALSNMPELKHAVTAVTAVAAGDESETPQTEVVEQATDPMTLMTKKRR